MEAFFLDVAQGASQVLLLGGRRAIVIDCGSRGGRTLLQFLKRMNVQELEGLIVSHSHSDHMGGAVAVLGAYKSRIKRIGFIQDDQFLETGFWSRLSDLILKGIVSRNTLFQLEATDRPQLFWDEPSMQAELSVWSPTAAENLFAQVAKSPNPTSAVLILSCAGHRIVFAADSETSQWREVHQKYGKINCDALSVPHHGGDFFETQNDLNWFFNDAVSSKIAVVSVGTSNTYKHPRADVIKTAIQSGTTVACTQFTRRCNCNQKNYDLESIRPGVLHPQMLPRMSNDKKELTDSGNSRNVACAGTVQLEISNGGFQYVRRQEHQLAVDDLHASGAACPMCR